MTPTSSIVFFGPGMNQSNELNINATSQKNALEQNTKFQYWYKVSPIYFYRCESIKKVSANNAMKVKFNLPQKGMLSVLRI